MKLANTFEVGCDPEFVMLDAAGGIVSTGSLGKQGPVGYDHSGYCAEVRPDKAKGTWTLVKRIQQILLECPKLATFRSPGVRWLGGAIVDAPWPSSKKLTLGGHLHFNLIKLSWTDAITAALDRVTKHLEELDILPTKQSQERRAVSNNNSEAYKYGKFSDLRWDAPDGHTEYRTMASWLYDPWIAFLVLTTAKLAVVAPDLALEKFAGGADKKKLQSFLEAFANKDDNAERLLHKMEHATKWMQAKPDTDIKTAWENF